MTSHRAAAADDERCLLVSTTQADGDEFANFSDLTLHVRMSFSFNIQSALKMYIQRSDTFSSIHETANFMTVIVEKWPIPPLL